MLLSANYVVSLLLRAALSNCTLKAVSYCFNLGWISLSITDVFCVKHAQFFPHTAVSSFRWHFGRPDFRQAAEEGFNLWNDAIACSTHSKSWPLSQSCGWDFDSIPWEVDSGHMRCIFLWFFCEQYSVLCWSWQYESLKLSGLVTQPFFWKDILGSRSIHPISLLCPIKQLFCCGLKRFSKT